MNHVNKVSSQNDKKSGNTKVLKRIIQFDIYETVAYHYQNFYKNCICKKFNKNIKNIDKKKSTPKQTIKKKNLVTQISVETKKYLLIMIKIILTYLIKHYSLRKIH